MQRAEQQPPRRRLRRFVRPRRRWRNAGIAPHPLGALLNPKVAVLLVTSPQAADALARVATALTAAPLVAGIANAPSLQRLWSRGQVLRFHSRDGTLAAALFLPRARWPAPFHRLTRLALEFRTRPWHPSG
ncbi:MAG: hypothetical protein JST54_04065 [Deltaproteobacteria bacterium]|nr:hypothetical protein [Deltaproteobacteria bacterium]